MYLSQGSHWYFAGIPSGDSGATSNVPSNGKKGDFIKVTIKADNESTFSFEKSVAGSDNLLRLFQSIVNGDDIEGKPVYQLDNAQYLAYYQDPTNPSRPTFKTYISKNTNSRLYDGFYSDNISGSGWEADTNTTYSRIDLTFTCPEGYSAGDVWYDVMNQDGSCRLRAILSGYQILDKDGKVLVTIEHNRTKGIYDFSQDGDYYDTLSSMGSLPSEIIIAPIWTAVPMHHVIINDTQLFNNIEAAPNKTTGAIVTYDKWLLDGHTINRETTLPNTYTLDTSIDAYGNVSTTTINSFEFVNNNIRYLFSGYEVVTGPNSDTNPENDVNDFFESLFGVFSVVNNNGVYSIDYYTDNIIEINGLPTHKFEYQPVGDLTLQAKWLRYGYTVRYQYNGDISSGNEKNKIKEQYAKATTYGDIKYSQRVQGMPLLIESSNDILTAISNRELLELKNMADERSYGLTSAKYKIALYNGSSVEMRFSAIDAFNVTKFRYGSINFVTPYKHQSSSAYEYDKKPYTSDGKTHYLIKFTEAAGSYYDDYATITIHLTHDEYKARHEAEDIQEFYKADSTTVENMTISMIQVGDEYYDASCRIVNVKDANGNKVLKGIRNIIYQTEHFRDYRRNWACEYCDHENDGVLSKSESGNKEKHCHYNTHKKHDAMTLNGHGLDGYHEAYYCCKWCGNSDNPGSIYDLVIEEHEWGWYTYEGTDTCTTDETRHWWCADCRTIYYSDTINDVKHDTDGPIRITSYSTVEVNGQSFYSCIGNVYGYHTCTICGQNSTGVEVVIPLQPGHAKQLTDYTSLVGDCQHSSATGYTCTNSITGYFESTISGKWVLGTRGCGWAENAGPVAGGHIWGATNKTTVTIYDPDIRYCWASCKVSYLKCQRTGCNYKQTQPVRIVNFDPNGSSIIDSNQDSSSFKKHSPSSINEGVCQNCNVSIKAVCGQWIPVYNQTPLVHPYTRITANFNEFDGKWYNFNFEQFTPYFDGKKAIEDKF